MSAIVPFSPPRSAAGWSPRVWLARNKGVVKGTLAVGAGYLASLLGVIHDPNLNAFASGAFALAVKFGLDWFDFWLREVQLP